MISYLKQFSPYLVIAAIAIFSMINIMAVHSPLTRDYQAGEISRRDIYAPLDFSFSDQANNLFEIKKNEIILRRGQRVTKAHRLTLSELRQHQSFYKQAYLFLGSGLTMIMFFVVMLIYLKLNKISPALKQKNLWLIAIFSVYIIIFARVIIQSPDIPVFLIPLASFSMLMAILIGPRLSFILSVVFGLFIGIMDNLNFNLSLILITGAVVGIYALEQIRRRSHLTNAGLLVGGANFIVIVGLGLLSGLNLNELFTDGLWGALNGIGSAMLVAGISPVFESIFRISTNISLLELSDFNQPLLKELNMSAPGTYHHSLIVGNLAESAAEALGANSLLARVGAYYHDIGKMKMPHYFSENQFEDKHGKLAPTISTLIITNHVKEGMDVARHYKLNHEISDIIEQHHGTSLVYFFYHRALERTDAEADVKKEEFRYAGPKPQTKEAAIVLLADSVEAASRTISEPTPGRLKELIQRVINNKFIDGQLDECDLSLKDLHEITEIFTHILSGIYHTRVEYPVQAPRHDRDKNREQTED